MSAHVPSFETLNISCFHLSLCEKSKVVMRDWFKILASFLLRHSRLSTKSFRPEEEEKVEKLDATRWAVLEMRCWPSVLSWHGGWGKKIISARNESESFTRIWQRRMKSETVERTISWFSEKFSQQENVAHSSPLKDTPLTRHHSWCYFSRQRELSLQITELPQSCNETRLSFVKLQPRDNQNLEQIGVREAKLDLHLLLQRSIESLSFACCNSASLKRYFPSFTLFLWWEKAQTKSQTQRQEKNNFESSPTSISTMENWTFLINYCLRFIIIPTAQLITHRSNIPTLSKNHFFFGLPPPKLSLSLSPASLSERWHIFS